jgi:hypothetical protein
MLVKTYIKFCADKRRNIISYLLILKKMSSYEELQKNGLHEDKGVIIQACDAVSIL